MRNKIVFATGNEGKWKTAADIFDEYVIEVIRDKIETPEIQTLNVREVAEYSAKYAAEKLQKPVMNSDVGYYIEALGGFPGPFIKFVNQTLTPDDILSLMANHENRKMVIKECLSYCEPGEAPISFITEQNTKISYKAKGEGSTIDQVMILEGFEEPKGACDPEMIAEHWKDTLHVYHDLAKWLRSQY